MEAEINFILETASPIPGQASTRDDILSVFAGIRPLVKSSDASSTAALCPGPYDPSRQERALTIAGGKWTTYRKMAEDCVDHAITLARLDERPCVTRTLNIHGYHRHPEQFGDLSYYGSDAPEVRTLMDGDPALSRRLHDALPIYAAQVLWSVRREMARTVDDVLARRTHLLLNAAAAIEMAGDVARLLAAELGRDEPWQSDQVAEFTVMAQNYLIHRPQETDPPFVEQN